MFTFVGRDSYFDLLNNHLAELRETDRPAAVVICGFPGVGKTALVLEWSYRHRKDFPDGDLYIDLHGFDLTGPASTGEVFDIFLRALGVPPVELPGLLAIQEAMYKTLISDLQILVVLDNASSAELVRPFLAGSRSTVLITSRNQLAGLSARDGVGRMNVDTFSPGEALELLRQIAGRGRIDGEPAASAELARLCGYLPLALRIAAEQLNARPYLTISEHVQDLQDTGELDALSIDGDERSEIRIVFSWSYQALNEQTAYVFRLLGLAPSRDVSLPAARLLTDLSERSVRRALQALASASLLTETPSGRYRFHDLLWAYSQALVRSEESMDAQSSATRRLVRWYLASADNANKLIAPGYSSKSGVEVDASSGVQFSTYSDAVHWLDDERANLLDVTRQARQVGEHHAAAEMPNLLWGYFNITKHWNEWMACNDVGLQSAREVGDKKAEAFLLTSQGVAFRNLRQTEQSVNSHQQAIALFEQSDELEGLGYASQNLGNALSDVRRFEEAMPHFDRALRIFQMLPGARRGLGITLNSLGVAYNSMGENSRALEIALQALQLMQAIGDDHGVAFALHTIGYAYLALGQLNDATANFEEALDLRRQINDRYGAARTLQALGQAYAESGRRDEAGSSWQSALDLFTALGAPERADVLELISSLPPSEPDLDTMIRSQE